MLVTCDYCASLIGEGETKCGNCGAPIVSAGAAFHDFRCCPVCHRRLLSLASPACNYCGRRLPDEYIKARESDFKRIRDVSESEGTSELGGKVSELIRETARHKRAGSPAHGLFDISDLIDFFD